MKGMITHIRMRRRSRINEKLKALQTAVPNSNKVRFYIDHSRVHTKFCLYLEDNKIHRKIITACGLLEGHLVNAFVEFDDRRDALDVIRALDGFVEGWIRVGNRWMKCWRR